MNKGKFWRHIESIDRTALASGDDAQAFEPLIVELSAFPPKEIRAFEEHLANFLFKIDGARFAENAGESGDSDDAFLTADATW